MRKTLASLVVACAGLSAVAASMGQTPPVPAPNIPPPPTYDVPSPPTDDAPPPPPAADGSTPEAEAKASPTAEIRLGEKRECIRPGTLHDGLAEGGKIEVKAEADTLTMTMTGAVAAHCFIGTQSVGVQEFQLVQEFDVVAAGGANPREVVLTMESALRGYVRSRHKGNACMKLAGATITPAGWGSSPLAVNFPSMCASGPGCAREYKQEFKPPAGPPMPLGRYTLVANFVIEATATGLLNGRAVADFSPDELPDIWQQEGDPFKEADRENFGFSLTLKAEAPAASGAGQARADGPVAVRIKAPEPRVRRVGFAAPKAGVAGPIAPR